MIKMRFYEFRNILFDLDGTVTDPYEGITASILYSLEYFPEIRTPGKEELKTFIGPPLSDSYRRYFGMSEQEAGEAVERYREYYREKGIFENRLYDGMKELLSAIKNSGKSIYLATSKPEIFARRILEYFDIYGYFDGVYGSSLDGKTVKKEDIIALLIERQGCDPRDTLMVGDTVYDIIGAARCSIKAVGVTYGYGDEEVLRKAGAAATVKTVEELRELLINTPKRE